MKPTILIIDDDVRPMQFYQKALKQAGFEVEQRLNPDTALAFLKTPGTDVSLIILDIMMSPGKTFEHDDTREGLNTGRFLFEVIRKGWPEIPLIVLTNVSLVDLGPLAGSTQVFRKIDLDPFELASIAQSLAVSGKRSDAPKRQKKGNGQH